MWFHDHVDPISDDIAEAIKDDLWVNPLNYYLVPDIEVDNGGEEENNSDCDDNETVEVQTEDIDVHQNKDDV